MEEIERNGNEVAIVGFAINVPGANDIASFWQLITDKEEPITVLTDDKLKGANIPDAQIKDNNYVKKAFVVPDIDKFDAPFFSMTTREAEILDPQQRLFLELCWKGMEHAGYTPAKYDGRIGAFAGVFSSSYLMNIYSNPALMASVGEMAVRHGNEKDYLATRLAYKLNLTGPCLSIQTSCSSSLVSVHVAAQSLIMGETDMAIAGGVSVLAEQNVGYLYQEGGLTAKDGHCRPFDADTKGTVFGNGLGVVILKRLEDAIADNDTIYSVILGSAINNDGADKIGFTAPSAAGQSAVIAEALEMSGVSAETIELVEAHGTGTPLGDPIEISALTSVYSDHTDKKQYCAIGSVKSNIGHLGAASGVAGLIKASLSLYNQTLPPTINFSQPNPNIAFEDTPFRVSTECKSWALSKAGIRRAAVSSFGMGGTNAHLILEEYRSPETQKTSVQPQLLVASAKTETALSAQLVALKDYFSGQFVSSLDDVAFTLSQGRDAFTHRAAWVASDADESLRILQRSSAQRPVENKAAENTSVIFAFPGQGSQFLSMGRELYKNNGVFQDAAERCLEIAETCCDLPLRELFTSDTQDIDTTRTELAQLAIFIFGYAQVQLLQHLNIKPSAVMGHSIGELVAATVAGVFDLHTAIRVVITRAELMQSMPEGDMLAVSAERSTVEMLSETYSDLSIAAVNSPDSCVVSGPRASVQSFNRICQLQGMETRELHTSHAFHSSMMNEAAAQFEHFLSQVSMNEPALPLFSNLSGNVLTPQQAVSPAYWASHIVSPVLFDKCLLGAMQFQNARIVDMGPGTNITGFVAANPLLAKMVQVVTLHKHPKDKSTENSKLLWAAGTLWTSGVNVDLNALRGEGSVKRVPLPAYQFDRNRYWIDRANATPFDAPVAQHADQISSEHGGQTVSPFSQISGNAQSPGNHHNVQPEDIEGRLMIIWHGLFGLETLSADDDFFALGGTSLVAIQLISQVRNQFSIEFNVEDLFNEPTINGIAAQIRRIQGEDDEEALLKALLESEEIDLERI